MHYDLSTFTKINTCYIVTVNGNASIVATGGAFGTGTGCLSLDGNGDYLSVPDNNDWNRSANFTIDFWIKITSHDSDISAFCGQGGNATSSRWRLRYYNGNLEYEAYNGTVQTVLMQRAWTPSLNTWYHVAIVRSGTNYYMFIDGNQIGITYVDTDAIGNAIATLDIGRCFDAGGYRYLNGYMNEFRFSNYARWTTTFIPSSVPYISDTYTQLLLHLEENTNDFSDDYVVISEDGHRATFTDLPEVSLSYLYKDFGADYFENFEFNFDFRITDISADNAFVGLVKPVNILSTNSPPQSIYVEGTASDTGRLYATVPGVGGNYYSIVMNTPYYVNLKRIGGNMIWNLYGSDSDRTNQTNVLASYSAGNGFGEEMDEFKFRYLELVVSRGLGSASRVSGYIEHVELINNFDTDYYGHQFPGTLNGKVNIYQGDNIWISSNGDIHMVVANTASSGHMYYIKSTDGGATWTNGEGGGSGSVKTLHAGYLNNALNPAIVEDSQGNLYVFVKTDSALKYTKYHATVTAPYWDGTFTTIDSAFNGTFVRAEIDSNDNLIVYYCRATTIKIWTSDDGGTTWVNELDSAESFSYGDMALGYNNHIWFSKTSSGTSKAQRLTRSAVTGGYAWSMDAEENSHSVTTIYGTSIVVERNSEIVWQFLSVNDSGTYKIIYSKKTGGTWGSWITLVSGASNYYTYLKATRDYDNNIHVVYGINGTTPIAYLKKSSTGWSSPIALQSGGNKINVAQPYLRSGDVYFYYSYTYQSVNWDFFNSLNLSNVEESETVTLSEETNLRINLTFEENISLSEAYTFTREELIDEVVNLSEDVVLNVSLEKVQPSEGASLSEEVIVAYSEFEDINNDIHIAKSEIEDVDNIVNVAILDIFNIDNKINMVKAELEDINQKFNTVIEEEYNFRNAFHSVNGELEDIINDIRTLGTTKYHLTNDFRMRLSWQGVGLAGAQSLGKTYIRVYFNSVEQTDVDVDSISISKELNTSHTVSFLLGRPFDVNKPALETIVEIKYNDFLLYKGYITSISPGDTPEHINIECQDKYWFRNRTKVWFRVGHKPNDDRERYNLTIYDALAELGIGNFEIGHFIPQAMDLFSSGESEAISALVTESGNFGWFYTELGEKRLWTAGGGAIVNLERQELNKNIGLYQIISMNLTETVDNLVNKLRVQMGDQTIHVPGRQGETKEYVTRMFSVQRVTCNPDWESSLEQLARNSGSGYGFDYHPDGSPYGDVFVKYKFPSASAGSPTIGGDSKWTDLIPPYVEITRPFGSPSVPSGMPGILEEGYSIDWEDGTFTLNEPFYYYEKDDKGKMSRIGRPHITLILHKVKYITRTETDADNPDNDITNPLNFLTDQIGDYPITVLGTLNLGGLSIQGGGVSISRTGSGSRDISYNHTPTWNDTNFAKELAYWNLSKTAKPKITGTIQLTLDALLFYNIDLSKRIMIEGVLEEPLNINSISYNMSDFTVTLDVENHSYFKRSVSMSSHGEGMSLAYTIRSTAI
jgi:hypothetical protein